ncbi:hypothetical protein ACFC7A_13470 [Streptomyces niveus]|uniref:hypothetical protein n=1 Tax=Streptomyces niveus TaxID=193462 RepID=UPI0035DBF195
MVTAGIGHGATAKSIAKLACVATVSPTFQRQASEPIEKQHDGYLRPRELAHPQPRLGPGGLVQQGQPDERAVGVRAVYLGRVADEQDAAEPDALVPDALADLLRAQRELADPLDVLPGEGRACTLLRADGALMRSRTGLGPVEPVFEEHLDRIVGVHRTQEYDEWLRSGVANLYRD